MKSINDGLNSGCETLKQKVKSFDYDNRILKFENFRLLQANDDQSSKNKRTKDLNSIFVRW